MDTATVTVKCADISVIKDIMSQELTISHYSILSERYIIERFITAVKESKGVSEFKNAIEIIEEVCKIARSEGFLSISKTRGKSSNKMFGQIVDLLMDSVNLRKITSICKSLCYYSEGKELVESVLFHDGVIMTVLGYKYSEIELAMKNMLNG